MAAPFSDNNGPWNQPQWNPPTGNNNNFGGNTGQQQNQGFANPGTQQPSFGANSGFNSGQPQQMGGGGFNAPQQQQGGQQDMFSSFGGENPMMSMGVNAGRNFILGNVSKYAPFLDGFFASLRYYFAVNNTFCANKLKTLFLPVMKKNWARELSQEGGHKFAEPVYDENAPDLYLPFMGFLTYVLLVGFCKGQANQFTPETLVEVTSACLVTQVLEVVVLLGGMYAVKTNIPLLDLISYTGYMYIGLCINMSVGLLLGAHAFYLALLWTGGMMAFFIYKTMDQVVPHAQGAGGKSRQMLVGAAAGLQVVVMWWLGYSGELQ